MVKLQNSKSAKSIKTVETLGDLKKKLKHPNVDWKPYKGKVEVIED